MNHLEIEWRHLDIDGKTCDRCSDTGEAVRRVCKSLSEKLNASGWDVSFKETLLTQNEIADSNGILLNGIPLEEFLPQADTSENCCASCGELLGSPTMCRTIEYQDKIYEALPESLILEAVYRFVNQHKT